LCIINLKFLFHYKGKLEIIEDDINNTTATIERLDRLKLIKKKFLDQRISAPNPFVSYDEAMKFVCKISDTKIRDEMNKLLVDAWQTALS
jgi:hypothetical protein